MIEQRYLLDSNICIYAIEALSEPLRLRLADQAEGTVFLSTISLAEIAVGYGQDVHDAPGLSAFLSEIPPVPFDETAAKIHGTLPFKRARLDRLIAAHALALGFVLVTNNEVDFADVPGLKVENWTT